MILSELKSGQRARVLDVMHTGEKLQRLLDMGFVEGTEVVIIRNAPLLDPIDISVRGYQIALRRDEASGVEVEAL